VFDPHTATGKDNDAKLLQLRVF